MKIFNCMKPIVICCISVAAVGIAAAQDGVQTRSITSDDFASQRPAKSEAPGRKPLAAKPKSVTYKFARVDKNVIHSKKKIPKPKADNLAAKVTEIGVTVWKLRPPRQSETGAFLLPVLDDNQESKMWLAERVATDTMFNVGDRVRFAIESSDSGYLYVFGRETYSDGSFGAPYAVFSGSRTDDNVVRPGMLFDIPDQREDHPYFKMRSEKPNYSGEMLTIIISPKPLSELTLGKDGTLKNGESLANLEFGSEVEIFSRTDTADKIYSKAESESSCGVKTRELVREPSAAKPCGVSSRQLSREEPLPQSIYRVKAVAGQPAVAFVKLAIRR